MTETNGNENLLKVFLHNDDVSTMEFVVFILESIFDKSKEEAHKITLAVHNDGQGVAGTYVRSTAQAKLSAVKMLANAQGFPLRCTIENQEDEVKVEVKNRNKGKTPPGWIMAGSHPDDYEVTIDKSVFHSGDRCASVKDAVESPRGFGTLMQTFSANQYLEKRLHMKMWVKTEDVEATVQPWMRVDGPEKGKSLSFENTCNRPIEGTTDWQVCDIVLDVPKESTKIAFGVMLCGKGKLWIDDISFAEAAADVPNTYCPCSLHASKSPKNLSFEDTD
jgi:ATP-dependent Clp protease adapter protein ClpS